MKIYFGSLLLLAKFALLDARLGSAVDLKGNPAPCPQGERCGDCAGPHVSGAEKLKLKTEYRDCNGDCDSTPDCLHKQDGTGQYCDKNCDRRVQPQGPNGGRRFLQGQGDGIRNQKQDGTGPTDCAGNEECNQSQERKHDGTGGELNMEDRAPNRDCYQSGPRNQNGDCDRTPDCRHKHDGTGQYCDKNCDRRGQPQGPNGGRRFLQGQGDGIRNQKQDCAGPTDCAGNEDCNQSQERKRDGTGGELNMGDRAPNRDCDESGKQLHGQDGSGNEADNSLGQGRQKHKRDGSGN